MAPETPSISGYTTSNNTYQGLPVGQAAFISNTGAAPAAEQFWLNQGFDQDQAEALDKLVAETAAKPQRHTLFKSSVATVRAEPATPQKETIMARRIVQVYIADPNENVPLDDAILYTGSQKMTDLTDQELFFEIDIKTILADHNAKRVKMVDKKVKERVEHLEPAKVRDLKMVVVNVASF